MSVKIVPVEKGNPARPDNPKTWHGMVTSDGDVNLKTLGKYISLRCTVNPADTVAVLEVLTQVLTEELSDGKIVRFGDFGSFQAGVGSRGAETKEKFTTSLIRSRKVIFRPGADLKEMLTNLKFEKL
ncbi:MAG: HU family DNA-binding protein [Tannerella sp.]|jgi:predicted histone-like DNA-binding protein|nr:HU family DNA-binding protein [Tannerella sp.]